MGLETHGRGIFAREHRMLTVGIILAITAVAFEGLAVTTVAPALAADLGGVGLYGWVFSAYLLAQLVGTVVAGQGVDRHGPAGPFVGALLLFGVGLLAAAAAPGMPALIGGRVLQGLGGGAIGNCVYSSISLRYDDSLRPRMLAAVSSAFIVPALVGPALAGAIAEHLTWRAVFWGLLPLLPVAGALTLPAFRRVPPTSTGAGRNRAPAAVQVAAGTGLLLAGLGELPDPRGVLLTAAGLPLAASALRRLLPAGTFVARPGLPATVAARGLFVAGFFGAQAYLVLALTSLQGYPAGTAGLLVALGSLSWSAAAWLQARLDGRDRGRGRRARVVAGAALMLAGVVILLPVVWAREAVLALAAGGHALMGLGIGLAHPASGVIAFAQASEGDEGAVSANLQLADSFAPAVGIGAGGALVAIGQTAGWGPQAGVAGALGVNLLPIALSLVAAARLDREPGVGPPGAT